MVSTERLMRAPSAEKGSPDPEAQGPGPAVPGVCLFRGPRISAPSSPTRQRSAWPTAWWLAEAATLAYADEEFRGPAVQGGRPGRGPVLRPALHTVLRGEQPAGGRGGLQGQRGLEAQRAADGPSSSRIS
ncbi:MAG: hypothetical protein M0C28_12010 [Candidatus Moduliflexus flocculans]|nr:hypothetical protein [Candidatus Moduliflexus flocculans]